MPCTNSWSRKNDLEVVEKWTGAGGTGIATVREVAHFFLYSVNSD